MRTLQIPTAEVFEPLLAPARYKVAKGGRGSGKSHFFAGLLVEECLSEPGNTGEGMRAVCIREVQKDLTQSAKLLIEDKLAAFRLGEADGFRVFKDVIETPKDGIIIFKGMNDYSAESVKSLEKFKRAWWEEAQTATQHSLDLLRPTIREDGSELWFSMNPRFEADPVSQMFKGPVMPTGSVVVTANWSDNPWLPSVLEQERLDCLRDRPDQYGHIWEGEFVTVVEGAYFRAQLSEARQQGRIGKVARDPLMQVRAFWDLGGRGAKSDATAIWIAQFVDREIRVLDYYESVGQSLGTHIDWLRRRGWGSAYCVLPHDGAPVNPVADASWQTALESAGFDCEVIPNQGASAAMKRIEAARRVFPAIWFNEPTCGGGLSALGWYHEKIDEKRRIGLGPEHDWASHGADAFGLMCVSYETPRGRPQIIEPETEWIV